MTKIFSFLVKTLLVAGLFAYMIRRALQSSSLSDLDVRDFLPTFLLASLALNLFATAITLVRWRALVRALDAPLSVSDALRFGFIGLTFNLSPVGIVGGDVMKIYLLARKNGVLTPRATASVVMDRVVGLVAMFVLGLAAAFATGFYRLDAPLARFATFGLVALAVGATAFLALTLTPSSSQNRRVSIAAKIPFIGKPLRKIVEAILLYQTRKSVVFWSFAATLVAHLGFAASLYCAARGVFRQSPSFLDHVVLYCMGNVGSIIPLSAGPLEYFLDELYPLFAIPGRRSFQTGCGMAIGVVFRLASVVVALIGVVYYFLSSDDVKKAVSAAKEHCDVPEA